MTESILHLNVVLHLNHEKCVGNELNAAPIKHVGGFGEKEKTTGKQMGGGGGKGREEAMKDERGEAQEEQERRKEKN